MNSKYLLQNPLDWLLDTVDPVIRYLTQRDIVDNSAADYESLTMDRRIREMNKTAAGGVLGDTTQYDLYYRGTMWNFAVSVEYGLDCRSSIIQKTGDYILNEFQINTGGFTLRWKPRMAVSCRTGDMIRYLLMAGFMDSRIVKGVSWIVENQRHDGGWLHCPLKGYCDFILLALFNKTGEYRQRENDRTVKSCIYGTYACINALLLYPEKDDLILSALRRSREYILNHRVFKTSGNSFIKPNFGWNKDFRLLGYPVLSQFDLLYGLITAARAGCIDDPLTGEAFNLLISKQNPDGTWNLENAATGMLSGDSGKVQLGKPNKWVTLNALRLLSYMK